MPPCDRESSILLAAESRMLLSSIATDGSLVTGSTMIASL